MQHNEDTWYRYQPSAWVYVILLDDRLIAVNKLNVVRYRWEADISVRPLFCFCVAVLWNVTFCDKMCALLLCFLRFLHVILSQQLLQGCGICAVWQDVGKHILQSIHISVDTWDFLRCIGRILQGWGVCVCVCVITHPLVTCFSLSYFFHMDRAQ